MWRRISSGLDLIYRLCGYGAGVLLLLLCGLILYSVVARLFSLYAGGAADFAGYVMATSTFMALAYTFRSNGHIRVTLLIQRAHGSPRRGLEVLGLGVMAAITTFVAVYMTRLALDSYDYGERSQGADAVLLWIPQVPVAMGAIIFAVSVVHSLVQAIFDYDAVDPEAAGHEGPTEI